MTILGDPGAVSGGRESLNRREKNSGEEKSILGDPGAVSGGRESLNRREKNSGEEKSRTKIRAPLIFVLDFSSPEFFSRLFRLSLPPLTAPGSPRMTS